MSSQIKHPFILVGSYRATVQLDRAPNDHCAHITKPTGSDVDIIDKILTCSHDTEEYKWGNRINIHNEDGGPITLFEVKILGMFL